MGGGGGNGQIPRSINFIDLFVNVLCYFKVYNETVFLLCCAENWMLFHCRLIYWSFDLCFVFSSQLVKKYTQEALDSYALAGAVAEEVLSSIRTVIAFGGETKELDRWAIATYSTSLNDNHAQLWKSHWKTGAHENLSWFQWFHSGQGRELNQSQMYISVLLVYCQRGRWCLNVSNMVSYACMPLDYDIWVNGIPRCDMPQDLEMSQLAPFVLKTSHCPLG